MEEFPFKKFKKKLFAVIVCYFAIILSGVLLGFLAFRLFPDPLLQYSSIGAVRTIQYTFMMALYTFLLAIFATIKVRRFVENLEKFENSVIDLVEKNKKTDKTFCVKCGIIVTSKDFIPSKKEIKIHYFNGFRGYFCRKCFKENFIRSSILLLPFMLFILWFILGEINILVILINSVVLIGIILDMILWYRYYKRYII